MINLGLSLFSAPSLWLMPGKRRFGGSYTSAGSIFKARHDSLVTLTSKPSVRVEELHFAMNNIILHRIPIRDSLFSAPLLIAFQDQQFQVFRQGGLAKKTAIPLEAFMQTPVLITASNFMPNNRCSRSVYVPWEGSIEVSGKQRAPRGFRFKFVLTLKPS